MKITSVILNDFANFKDTGISKLSISFTEDVQIIIGSNGSGKTQFLRQLSLFPQTRSLFGKKGMKSTVVEHGKVFYRIESEYEKPSSPHLFYEGDSEENLNVGRTTDIQKELIYENLGVTALIDDLMMNRYEFPKWTVSKRKEFLMGVNPDQIGFVLPLIKQKASEIKACRNNISRLQARKIILEQDILDDDTLQTLIREKENLNEDLNHFQQYLMTIELGSRSITVNPNQTVSVTFDLLNKEVIKCRKTLVSLPHISRDDHERQHQREDLLTKIAMCTQRMEETDILIQEQTEQLFEQETKYRELAVDGDASGVQLLELDALIARLEQDRDKLQVSRPPFEISASEIQQRYEELETLRDKLHIFSSLTIKLLSTKRRQHRERMLQTAQYRQSSYRNRLQDLREQFDAISRRHTLSPSDIPDSPCAKDKCPLYSHFMGEYQNTEAQRNRLARQIKKGEHKTDRLDRYTEALITYFQNAKPYNDVIQWLIGEAQRNPILHHTLKQMDILSVLSSNPNRIPNQLNDAYQRIEQWHRLKQVMSDLETTYALRARQISTESQDTISLVTGIETLKKSLYDLRGKVMTISHTKRDLQYKLEQITTFNRTKETLLAIQKQYEQQVFGLVEQHEHRRLSWLKSSVEMLRTQHLTRLGDIERTIRQQTNLQYAYQEEVLSQLALIEKELSDLQQIEMALIAIPKENMVGFINDVFDQANRLIKTIWTVPLEIELLHLDNPLTYEFQVKGDNGSVREMSECSEGQTEMISLAINLALRIVLEHLNYPLCLDEPATTFDEQHRYNFTLLLKKLLEEKVISQLFMVSHNVEIHTALVNSEVFVVRADNILVPETYNEHVSMM